VERDRRSPAAVHRRVGPPAPLTAERPVLLLGAAPDVADALRAAGLIVTDDAPPAPGAIVVIGGPAGERAARTREAVDAGAHAFLAWPPGVSPTEAAALAARADEAGVEVGAARPLPVGALLAGVPGGWTSRLTTLAVEMSPEGPLGALPPAHVLAGALDLCAALAGTHDAARMDAAAEGPLTAVAVRFRTGAVAHVALRADAPEDRVALAAAGPGATVDARSLAGPLCVDGRATPPAAPEHEAVAFVRAVGAGRRAPSTADLWFSLDRAVATMRLVEAVRDRLR